jgi:hypothetical protein
VHNRAVRRALWLCVFALFVAAPGGAAAEPQPLLPDLTQETPYALGVVTDGKRYHLGFGSVVYNYGDGPLRIVGSRASRDDPTMAATQVVESSDGTRTRNERIGELRYVDSVTHRHWHYLKFDTYSLRRPDGTVARPDRKTGFCLGDRLVAPRIGPLPAMPPAGEYQTNCGFDDPGLLEVQEGISVGYGDDYGPQLEGQYVDLTRLPPGRYALVHRVNADGALQEKSLENNASSVLIDLRYRRGVPRVAQVARCPLSASCPVAPALSRRRAVRFAREAFRRAYRSDPSAVTCTEPVDDAASCGGHLPSGDATVEVRYSVSDGRLFWTYAATSGGATETRRGRVPVALGRVKTVPVSRQNAFAPRSAARVAYCPLIGRG